MFFFDFEILVLGANYGTGRMGGLMSVFIMGVYDEDTDTFRTVCRVDYITMIISPLFLSRLEMDMMMQL